MSARQAGRESSHLLDRFDERLHEDRKEQEGHREEQCRVDQVHRLLLELLLRVLIASAHISTDELEPHFDLCFVFTNRPTVFLGACQGRLGYRTGVASTAMWHTALLLVLAVLRMGSSTLCLRHDDAVPRIGFGTYRVSNNSEHVKALRRWMLYNRNHALLDTSANYGDGSAEEAVGVVVRDLIAAGELTRKKLTIVSKFGYIQDQNLRRERAGLIFDETVPYSEDLHHSIHPDFMEDQLKRSIER